MTTAYWIRHELVGFAGSVPATLPTTFSATAMPKILVALAALWLCWGTSFPAMRVMVATLPPLLASGAVFLVAGVALALARPRFLRGISRRQVVKAAGVGICFLGAQGTIAVAEQYVFASTAALLAASVPLWVIVLRMAYGDRPATVRIARFLVGFGGVAVVLLASSSGPNGWNPWNLAVLGAAVAWAVGTLYASRLSDLPPAGPSTVVQLLAGGATLLAVGMLAGEADDFTPASVHVGSWAALVYLVLVDSLAGFVLYNWLLRKASVTIVSTYAYAVPVVAYLVGVIVLDEPFHLVVLIGAAAIVATVCGEILARDPDSGPIQSKAKSTSP